MKDSEHRALRRWCITGVFVVMGLATLWHFIYEWLPCGFLSVIGLVNESPWEHVKLFFIPPLIWYIVVYFAAGRRYPNFVFAAAVSLVLMPAFMLALYGVYSQFLEETLLLNIANTLVTIAFGMWVTYRLTVSKRRLHGPGFSAAAVIIIAGLIVLYGQMTYDPPHIPLFYDTEAGNYGIPR